MSDLPNRRPPQPPLVRAAVDEDRWRRQLIDSITDLQAAVQLVSERVDRIADATLTRAVGRQLIGWDAPMTSSPGEEPALPNMPEAVRDKLYAHLGPAAAGDGTLTAEERGAGYVDLVTGDSVPSTAPRLVSGYCRTARHPDCDGTAFGTGECSCSCHVRPRPPSPDLAPCKWCRAGQHASCTGSDMHGLSDCPCTCETAMSMHAPDLLDLPDPPPDAPPPPPVPSAAEVDALDRHDEAEAAEYDKEPF